MMVGVLVKMNNEDFINKMNDDIDKFFIKFTIICPKCEHAHSEISIDERTVKGDSLTVPINCSFCGYTCAGLKIEGKL